MFCSYCDSKLFEEDRVCPQCGAGTKNSYPNKEEVEKSPFEDILAIAVQNFPEKMTCGQSLDLKVYGIPKNGSPYILPNNTIKIVPEKNNIFITTENIIKAINVGSCSVRVYSEVIGQYIDYIGSINVR